MQSLSGNKRYSIPTDENGEEYQCVRLDADERAFLRPDFGIQVGNIRVGKRAYNCAFVAGFYRAETSGTMIWIYMSKSTFLRFMEQVSKKGSWGKFIEVQYYCKNLEIFPPPESERMKIRSMVHEMFETGVGNRSLN